MTAIRVCADSRPAGARPAPDPSAAPRRLRHRPAAAGPGDPPGLFAVVVDADVQGGLTALVGAAVVGLALAAGVTLGESPGEPVGARRDRYDERVRRPAMTAN